MMSGAFRRPKTVVRCPNDFSVKFQQFKTVNLRDEDVSVSGRHFSDYGFLVSPLTLSAFFTQTCNGDG
jgi:hypothetical protein